MRNAIRTCPVCKGKVEMHLEGWLYDHTFGEDLCPGNGMSVEEPTFEPEKSEQEPTLFDQILAVMPEGARHHWEYSEQSREKHGDRGCTCDLCQTLTAVRDAR